MKKHTKKIIFSLLMVALSLGLGLLSIPKDVNADFSDNFNDYVYYFVPFTIVDPFRYEVDPRYFTDIEGNQILFTIESGTTSSNPVTFYLTMGYDGDFYIHFDFSNYNGLGSPDIELYYIIREGMSSFVTLDSINYLDYGDDFDIQILNEDLTFVSSSGFKANSNFDSDDSNNLLLWQLFEFTFMTNTIYVDENKEIYQRGYDVGYQSGRDNVLRDPRAYNLYTATQYANAITSAIDDGMKAVIDNPSSYDLYTYNQYITYGQTEYNGGFNRAKEIYQGGGANFEDLVTSVVDAPIREIFGWNEIDSNGNVVKRGGLLNFEILGVNLADFFTALFTIALCITILGIFL